MTNNDLCFLDKIVWYFLNQKFYQNIVTMENIKEKLYNNIKVIQNKDYKWGVEDDSGKVIVPYGKYDWIDSYWNDLARVSKRNKWGAINTKGEEVIPVVFDNMWNFCEKDYDSIIVEIGGPGNTAKTVAVFGYGERPKEIKRYRIKFDNLDELIPCDLESKYDDTYTIEIYDNGGWTLSKKQK